MRPPNRRHFYALSLRHPETELGSSQKSELLSSNNKSLDIRPQSSIVCASFSTPSSRWSLSGRPHLPVKTQQEVTLMKAYMMTKLARVFFKNPVLRLSLLLIAVAVAASQFSGLSSASRN